MSQGSEGVYVAAFDRSNGLPVKSFGVGGVRLVEGRTLGNQGRIEPFRDDLFLVIRTDPRLEDEKHEVKIGDTVLRHGEMEGLLFRLRKDGTVANN